MNGMLVVFQLALAANPTGTVISAATTTIEFELNLDVGVSITPVAISPLTRVTRTLAKLEALYELSTRTENVNVGEIVFDTTKLFAGIVKIGTLESTIFGGQATPKLGLYPVHFHE